MDHQQVVETVAPRMVWPSPSPSHRERQAADHAGSRPRTEATHRCRRRPGPTDKQALGLTTRGSDANSGGSMPDRGLQLH